MQIIGYILLNPTNGYFYNHKLYKNSGTAKGVQTQLKLTNYQILPVYIKT